MAIRPPLIRVEKDYDGYFEALVRGLIREKEELGEPFRHHEVVVSAGPFRPNAVTWKHEGLRLRLDFYSALRSGFGNLSRKDKDDLRELL